MRTQILRRLPAIDLFLILLVAVGGMDGFSTFSRGQSPARNSKDTVLKLILSDGREQYTFGDDIRFQQKMKNESDGQAAFQGFDFYYQNRPKLLRNGKAVPYKSKTDDLVRSKETDPGGLFISVRLVRIEAHSDRNLEELDLSDWYDALQPGSYELTNKYRTSFKGPWTKESAEIQFRIEPKN
jgi:hypothetical protein